MTWNTTWPNVAVSVKANGTTGTQNTLYIETTERVDHFFNESDNKDGHHQWVMSPELADGDDPSVEANPLPDDIDGATYFKKKLAAESLDQQDVQPFYRNADMVMQLLGIRACGVFDFTNSNGAVTLQYAHNCTVARTGTGLYTVTFVDENGDDRSLPSDNYLVFGGGIPVILSGLNVSFYLRSAASLSRKAIGLFDFTTADGGSSNQSTKIDPLQTWFVVFGG